MPASTSFAAALPDSTGSMIIVVLVLLVVILIRALTSIVRSQHRLAAQAVRGSIAGIGALAVVGMILLLLVAVLVGGLPDPPAEAVGPGSTAPELTTTVPGHGG